MQFNKLPQELINEVEKACEVTKSLVECEEKIYKIVEQLKLSHGKKQTLLKCIKEYTDYGCFADVSLELILRNSY